MLVKAKTFCNQPSCIVILKTKWLISHDYYIMSMINGMLLHVLQKQRQFYEKQTSQYPYQ